MTHAQRCEKKIDVLLYGIDKYVPQFPHTAAFTVPCIVTHWLSVQCVRKTTIDLMCVACATWCVFAEQVDDGFDRSVRIYKVFELIGIKVFKISKFIPGKQNTNYV